MPILKAGSEARVGFVLGYNPFFRADEFTSLFAELENCLMASGQFADLSFEVFDKGAFDKDYIVVFAVTAQDFGDVEDFGSLVAYELERCPSARLKVKVERRDPVAVKDVPKEVKDDPAYAQPKIERSGPSPKGECEDLDFLDQLACNIGFGAKSGQQLILLGGVLLGVGLLIRK